VEGFVAFLLDRTPACVSVCNRTIDYWLSSFRFLLFAEKRQILTEAENMVLQRVLMERRRKLPDCRRVTGAMNKVRTEKFIEWIDARKETGDEHISLSAEERQICKDAATTLYGGALRVFQLQSLQTNSFQWRTNKNGDKELWLTVLSKGGEARAATFDKKKVPSMESKPLHPAFQQRVEEIITRRSRDVRVFAGFTEGIRAKFSKCLQFCCKELGWPGEQRFSGTHCFRHGAAQDAYVEGGLSLAMIRTGHLSQAACAMYALSDEERSALIRKGIDAKRVADERVEAARKQAADYAAGGPMSFTIFGPPRVVADIFRPRTTVTAVAPTVNVARCAPVGGRAGIAARAEISRRTAIIGIWETAMARVHAERQNTAAGAARGSGDQDATARMDQTSLYEAAMARVEAERAAAAAQRLSPQIRPRSYEIL
jgi:hypothetical protein